MNSIKHYFYEFTRLMFIMPKSKFLRVTIFFAGMSIPYVVGQLILRPQDRVTPMILIFMAVISIVFGYFGRYGADK